MRISYAPWYRNPGAGRYPNLPSIEPPIGHEELRKKYKKASGKPFSPAELELLKKFLKEYKFKELINLLREWKNKEYLIEQPMMDPAMMDPAAQRMQMAKQAIQMQYAPLFAQAADIMFTLNSLEDPAAKQQARIYANRILAVLRDFFSGKEDPMESMMDLGPIVDEMGRKLQKFMS